jgi:MFS superfamily sulfate permease-like transporter
VNPSNPPNALPTARPANRYDRLAWAGAFGDLGTLAPFVIAYVSVLKLDPFGVLFGFGLSMTVAGWFYRTPFPVQPMKAVGAVATTQAAQWAVIAPGAVNGAGLVTGVIWLLLGTTGVAQRIARWISRPVAKGVVLGLGMAFMWQGVRLMASQWLLAGAGLLVVVISARSRRLPGVFVLMLMGVTWTTAVQPELMSRLFQARPDLRWPSFAWPAISWSDLVLGTMLLALPQVPLTLGNAIIGVREENNRLFPDRPVSDRQVAVSTGVMNLFGSAVGGVPMCHGAGGMAGHVAFGARTGGSLVILGVLLLVLATAFSGSVVALFEVIPQAVLGAILFMTGVQLASGQFDASREGNALTVLLVTAGLSMWNVGIGFVVGLALQALLLRRGKKVG